MSEKLEQLRSEWLVADHHGTVVAVTAASAAILEECYQVVMDYVGLLAEAKLHVKDNVLL